MTAHGASAYLRILMVLLPREFRRFKDARQHEPSMNEKPRSPFGHRRQSQRDPAADPGIVTPPSPSLCKPSAESVLNCSRTLRLRRFSECAFAGPAMTARELQQN